ncbi:MAG: hypothetical protein FD135_4850 [Comamonadaceae bacterium]|nr:MAG: hypothetical protein FD135_4850 [Comamonadaceae bacterium]
MYSRLWPCYTEKVEGLTWRRMFVTVNNVFLPPLFALAKRLTLRLPLGPCCMPLTFRSARTRSSRMPLRGACRVPGSYDVRLSKRPTWIYRNLTMYFLMDWSFAPRSTPSLRKFEIQRMARPDCGCDLPQLRSGCSKNCSQSAPTFKRATDQAGTCPFGGRMETRRTTQY